MLKKVELDQTKLAKVNRAVDARLLAELELATRGLPPVAEQPAQTERAFGERHLPTTNFGAAILVQR